MTKYIISKLESVEDIRKLLGDKRLIILQEALKYCKGKNVDKIRYTHLKYLCNDRLSDLTDGDQTDFGGSFEKYIIDLQSDSEPAKSFLKRYKQKPGKSFIIPDIPKIIDLLNRRHLNNLVETIESSKGPSAAMSLIDMPTGYSAVGYYFAQEEDNLGKSTAAVYTSNTVNIYTTHPEDKSFHLRDEDIQQLQHFTNIIASRDKAMPFKVTLEYKGDAHSSEKGELS
jgi:hypothetical protein